MLLEQLKKYRTFVYIDPNPYDGLNPDACGWVVSMQGKEFAVSYGDLGNTYLCSRRLIGLNRFKSDEDIISYLEENKRIFEDEMLKPINRKLYVTAA